MSKNPKKDFSSSDALVIIILVVGSLFISWLPIHWSSTTVKSIVETNVRLIAALLTFFIFRRIRFTTRNIVIMGILVAMNIVFTRLLSIQTATIRIGFGFVPIAVAGMLLGPIPAGLVAVLGDVIGMFINATGAFHPGITLNAFLTGLVFGLFLYKNQKLWRVLAAVAVNQGILSLFLQSYWLFGLYNMSGTDAYRALVISRIPQTLIVGAAQLITIPMLAQLVKRMGGIAQPVVAVKEEPTAKAEVADVPVVSMTGQEAVDYLENYTYSATKLGLERTQELLKLLGNPQEGMKYIHVTGSNGKGSTCAMLSSILRRAGYKTGLYTSPYIQEFRERIQIDGEYISWDDLAKLTEKCRALAESMADPPSQFELVTALALQYFHNENCDIVIMEVGMGGALDATNVIPAPEVAVITNVGLEHTEYLGNTLEAIATTKSGIIKPGCSAVCYDGAQEVTNVVRSVCAEKNVPLTCLDFSGLKAISETLEGQTFVYKGREYSIPLLGPHQICNTAMALETVETLRSRGWTISDEDVDLGLQYTRWPARFEVLQHNPLCILDGGHNPQCAEALVNSLDRLLPGRKAVFLMGILGDKDYKQVIDMIIPYSKEFFTLTPLNPRAMSSDSLAEELRSHGAKATACHEISEGIDAAIAAAGKDGLVVIFGSLYLAGAVRTEFQTREKKAKATQRALGRAARKGLSTEQRASKSAAICEKLTRLPELSNAKIIFSYLAMPDEVELSAFHKWAEDNNKKVAFPLTGKHSKMEVYIPGADGGMIEDRYGITAPDPAKSIRVDPKEIDAVIVPMVGFDKKNHRLGQGGGYYDRYLIRCPKAKRIAVAFAEQEFDEVITDYFDIPMDMVVTD